jgi:uncharacterized coiled-coil DUF342 family protein
MYGYEGGAPSWVHKQRKEKLEKILRKILDGAKLTDEDLKRFGLDAGEL